MPLLIEFPKPEESFDVQVVAAEAAFALESYRRAPWTQIPEWARLGHLRRALELIDRLERLEAREL